jgi:hypothetical protein
MSRLFSVNKGWFFATHLPINRMSHKNNQVQHINMAVAVQVRNVDWVADKVQWEAVVPSVPVQ